MIISRPSELKALKHSFCSFIYILQTTIHVLYFFVSHETFRYSRFSTPPLPYSAYILSLTNSCFTWNEFYISIEILHIISILNLSKTNLYIKTRIIVFRKYLTLNKRNDVFVAPRRVRRGRLCLKPWQSRF